MLWKIEGPGIKTSYLFGTVHILPKEDFELKEKVRTAISQSEVMVMELDFSNPNISTEMMSNALMTGGENMSDYLSGEQFTTLDSLLIQTAGISLTAVEKMKPFMISTMLLKRFVEGEPASFEGTLFQMAMNDSMPIIGLETVEEQMALFDSIPYSTQAQGLVDLIEDEAGVKSMYIELINAYRAEDLPVLHKLILEEMNSPREEAFLLSDRNQSWILPLREVMNQHQAFIAVGAGHLAGESGVINLLRESGYRVSPVFN